MKVILGVVLMFVVTHGLDQLIRGYEKSVQQNELVAAIPVLAKSYKISFDLKPKSYSYGLHNVIQFTVGHYMSKYRNSTPALSFQEDKHNRTEFQIVTSINENPNRQVYIDELPLNEWTKVVISQQRIKNNKYVFTIDLNGTNVLNEENNKPQKFYNVKVFVSAPLHLSHNGLIRNLNLENGEPGQSLTNALETRDNVDNNHVVKLKKNNLVASLSILEKSFDISFDLKLNSFSDGYRSVIHLTMGEDELIYGDRVPGVWIFNEKLHVVFIPHHNFNSEPLPLNKWINVLIKQTVESWRSTLKIYINHEKVYEKLNPVARIFENIDVYAGDPWYDAQDGFIKNFEVWNHVQAVESKKSLKKDAKQKKAFGNKL